MVTKAKRAEDLIHTRWTPQEDIKIRIGVEKGHTVQQLMEVLPGRAYSAVTSRLRVLGLHLRKGGKRVKNQFATQEVKLKLNLYLYLDGLAYAESKGATFEELVHLGIRRVLYEKGNPDESQKQ